MNFFSLAQKSVILLFIILIIIGGISMGWQLFWKNTWQTLHQAWKLETTIQQAKFTLMQRDHAQQQSQQLQQTYTDLSRLLPENPALAAALQQFTQRAQKDGLTITHWQVGAPQPHQSYNSIPVEMEMLGTYVQLLKFLPTTVGTFPLMQWHNHWELCRQTPAVTTDNTAEKKDLLRLQIGALFYYRD